MSAIVVWGHGRSWVVHISVEGRITWSSQWFTAQADARRLADRMQQHARRAA